MITVSTVSHGHGDMVDALIQQLATCEEVGQIILSPSIPKSTTLRGKAGKLEWQV